MKYEVEIDWLGIGTRLAGFPADPVVGPNDVTTRTRPGLSFRYGRDQATALAPVGLGSGSVTLDNRDGRFSPRNPTSVISGKVLPARSFAVSTISYHDGIADRSPLFGGFTGSSPLQPDTDSRTVSVELKDRLAMLQGRQISTPLYQGITTGQAISYVLDAAGLPGGDLDQGVTVIPFWWEDGTDALTAIDKLVRSEGSPAVVFANSNSYISFRDRLHRTRPMNPGDTTQPLQATWRSSGSIEPTMHRSTTWEESWESIINTASVQVPVRKAQGQQVIWLSDSPIVLAAGQQTVVQVATSDPFFGAVVPQLNVDYTMRSGTVTMALTRDSGGSTGIVITAGSGNAAVVNTLRLRACPVPVVNTVTVSEWDSASIAAYGPRAMQGDLPWCNVYDADAIVTNTIGRYAQPLTRGSVRIVVTPKAPLALNVYVSSRVHIVDKPNGIDHDFYVENVQHDIQGPSEHVLTCGVEMVPNLVTTPLRFDTSGRGFDQGLFGSGGDDTANIFLFAGPRVAGTATAGHRFDEGVFAS